MSEPWVRWRASLRRERWRSIRRLIRKALLIVGAVLLGPIALGVSGFELANRRWAERTPTPVVIQEAHSKNAHRSFTRNHGVMVKHTDGSREFVESDRLHDSYAGFGAATGLHGWTDGLLEIEVPGERVRVGTSDRTLWLFLIIGVGVTMAVSVMLIRREFGEVLEDATS